MATELESAYRATLYRVFLPTGPFDLRIGEPAAAVDRWLLTVGQGDYGMITAYNPQSLVNTAEINARRQHLLSKHLLDYGQPVLRGLNIDPAGLWPVEPCFWIAGLSGASLCKLGRMFRQAALVRGKSGSAPQLLWVSENE